MNNNKFFKLITSKYFVLGIQFIVSLVAVYFVFKLNLIPTKYLITIIVVLLILMISFFAIIYNGEKNIKDGVTSKRSIITKIISLLVSIVLVVGCAMISRGDKFIEKVSNATGQRYVVSVIALKDSDINKKNLNGKKFGVSYEKDSTTLTTALADMEEDIGEQTYDKYDNYMDLSDALYSGAVDCIVVGEQYRSMLQSNHEAFNDETKVITSYSYDAKLEVTTKKTNVTENPFSVYVTGIDVYGSLKTVSRSDVNLIVTVNPKTKQILMTSIPRDYFVTLANKGKKDKLTHAGIFGVANSVKTVEGFMDIDVNYYAKVNFTSLVTMVDALGGITVDSPVSFTTRHGNYKIVKGANEMDGAKALGFVRERYGLKGGDNDRVKNQQRVLTAMLKKMMSPAIITNYSSILNSIAGSFETNMSSSEITALLQMQINDMTSWDIHQIQLTGKGAMKTGGAMMPNRKLYYMIPDESSISNAKSLIQKMINGEKITINE